MCGCNVMASNYVREIVRRKGIDCDWRDDGKYHAAVNRKGHAALTHFAEGLARIADVTGTGFYQSALFTPGCSTVQPAALMRGLAAT